MRQCLYYIVYTIILDSILGDAVCVLDLVVFSVPQQTVFGCAHSFGNIY